MHELLSYRYSRSLSKVEDHSLAGPPKGGSTHNRIAQTKIVCMVKNLPIMTHNRETRAGSGLYLSIGSACIGHVYVCVCVCT